MTPHSKLVTFIGLGAMALSGCTGAAPVAEEHQALGTGIFWPIPNLPPLDPTPPPPAPPPSDRFPVSTLTADEALGADINAARRMQLGNGPVVTQMMQQGSWINDGTSELVRLTAAQHNLLRHFHTIGARVEAT